MQGPLVSVILPLFNGERFIVAALQSVFAQDYRPSEIIVVDDGSTDGGAALVQSQEHVRYIYQSHQGIAQAWNAGLAAAQGEFIAFQAQDDLWAPRKLSLQVHYLLCHPRVQYTVSKAKCFVDAEGVIPPGFRRELLEREHVARLLEAMVARTSVFQSIGPFDTGLSTSWDVDWFARAKDTGMAMAVLPKVLLHRRIHGDNITYRLREMGNQNLLRVLRRSVERQRSRSRDEHPEGNCGHVSAG
jgi:glycosyltransferase involved in cell wall biosynthesis